MGHYKSNLRDIEFNLFEVLGTGERLGSGPFSRPRCRHRPGHPGRGTHARRGSAGRLLRRRRPQPAGVRPGRPLGCHARVVQEVLRRLAGRRVVAAGDLPDAGRHPGPPVADLVDRRDGAGRQPGDLDVQLRPGVRQHHRPARHRRAAQDRAADHRQALGRHHGADRAGRRLRRRRRPHQGHPAGRRQLAHRGRQALHHLGRARHGRQHHPLRAGPPGGRRPRHQGPVAVPGAEVRLRLGHRRAGRAQRRAGHRRRAQDGTARPRPPARSPSASRHRPAAGCSARCTTASPRCSRSSSTPG